MSRWWRCLSRWLWLPLGAAVASCSRPAGPPAGQAVEALPRPPLLRPDYSDVVFPPNLAPPNLVVTEVAGPCEVRISAAQGQPLVVRSASGAVRFPAAAWRELAQANRGGELRMEVTARLADGRWVRYAPVVNRVAAEEIDPYLVYRRIPPLYNYWRYVAVYQRELGSFRQTEVLHGRRFGNGCVNCHTARNQAALPLAVGLRGDGTGNTTLLATADGRVTKLDTRWGYTAWHPSGRVAVYSLMKVRQFFHSAGTEIRDVADLDSDMVLHWVDTGRVTTAPALADPDRLETYPTWSPDGRTVYFSSAPFLWTNRDHMPPDHYTELRYSLMRATFDPTTGEVGPAETVLDSAKTGLSILMPRVSPDGRFVLVCMCPYGCFPIYQPGSDLYLLELATGACRRLDINSERSESYHSWSGNGRWIAFSSKRQDGLFTRTYIAYVETDGTVRKPFVLPQADPTYYESCLDTFSVPELTAQPVPVSARALARVARGRAAVKIDLPDTSTSPRNATPGKGVEEDHPWAPATPPAPGGRP